MTKSPSVRKAVWLVPLVVLVCALMVVPASATLESHLKVSSPSGTSSLAVSAGVGAKSALAGSAGPASSRLISTAPGPASTATGAANTGLSGAVERLEASGANPASVQLLERTEASIASGGVSPRDVYLPNFNIFAHPVSNPEQALSLYYTRSPAPMGVGDFGLGSTINTTYSLNTSAIRGTAVLDSYNATAGTLYEATGSYYWNGLAANSPGSPYQSGMQLNTVLANVTYPDSTSAPLGSGVFWTQNVPDFEGNTIQFIDNIWNFSAPGAVMEPGTLLSYDGTLVPYAYYYAIGPTIPAAYPMTMQLYNNASWTWAYSPLYGFYPADVVTFGYRVTEPTAVYTGIYDQVVFNSPPGTVNFSFLPQFRVDGFGATPIGALFDSEFVFTGPGGGSNSIISNLTGQLSMTYMSPNGTLSMTPRTAYDFGENTGETSIGVAATYQGTTADVVQGASLMYGLWGNMSTSVHPGAVPFTATLDPNYAFTFIGESEASGTIYAWVPSTPSGGISTMLPPSLPLPYGWFTVLTLADEYEASAFTVATDTAVNHIVISLTSAHGTLDTPLYMNGEAQATSLIEAIDQVASPPAAPYTFENLGVRLDPSGGYLFNLVNDYGFTTFNLFQSVGVSTPLLVDNVYQSPNTAIVGCLVCYYYPFFGGSFLNITNGSQEFVDYGGAHDTFENLDLPAYVNYAGIPLGGAISLWATFDVRVVNVFSAYGSYGVWASTTTGTVVSDSWGLSAAAVFSDIASSGAIGYNLTEFNPWAYAGSSAVMGVGTTGSDFTYVNSTFLAIGINGFWMNGTTASYVDANLDASGFILDNGVGLNANHLSASNLATAFQGVDVTNVVITDVTGTNETCGVCLDDSGNITTSGVATTGGSIGVSLTFVTNAIVSDTTASDASVAVGLWWTDQVSVTDTTVTDVAMAAYMRGTMLTSVVGVTASNATPVNLYTLYWDSWFWGSPFAAVASFGNTMLTVSQVTATNFGTAFYDDDSSGPSISSVNCTGALYGVVLNNTYDGLVTGINAYRDWTGMQLNFGWGTMVTLSSFVNDTSYGVVVWNSYELTITANNFIGDNGATSVYSPAHIQAWTSVSDLNFDGNYWADWHTYGPDGYLAPYLITGSVWDYHPVGPQETFSVAFTETGLATGTLWSVTLAGTTESATTATITFAEPMGGYDYQVGSVGGFTASPSIGTLTVGDGPYNVSVTFSAVTYAVTLSAGGLPTGLTWSATVNGVTQSTSSSSLVFDLPNGTYTYSFNAVTGYTLSAGANGTVKVVGSPVSVSTMYTPAVPPTYAVTLSEGGLSAGTTWSATVNGVTQSTSGSSLVFYLPAGTYTYSFNAVSGYNLPSTGATGSVTISTAPLNLATTYSPTSTPSYVQTNTFNMMLGVALAIAVVALVVALLVLVFRRRREPAPATAQAWTPPPEKAAAPATPPTTSGSAGSWSEGPPPSGGSPPS